MGRNPLDATGRKHGRLTALRRLEQTRDGYGYIWIWICSCGNQVRLTLREAAGRVSCGCRRGAPGGRKPILQRDTRGRIPSCPERVLGERLLREGVPFKEVAAQVGVSETTVNRWWRKIDLPRRRRGQKPILQGALFQEVMERCASHGLSHTQRWLQTERGLLVSLTLLHRHHKRWRNRRELGEETTPPTMPPPPAPAGPQLKASQILAFFRDGVSHTAQTLAEAVQIKEARALWLLEELADQGRLQRTARGQEVTYKSKPASARASAQN